MKRARGTTTYTREEFAKALLDDLGLEPRKQRLTAIVAWASTENTLADFNPLATTKTMPGSTDFNDNVPPVQNYESFQQGVSATVATLENGYYQRVLDALRDAKRAREILVAVGRSPWAGASDSYRDLLLAVLKNVEANYNRYADTLIGQ